MAGNHGAAGRGHHRIVGWAKRDRGEPHGPSPPTPPYVRVRIRRFDGLSGMTAAREGRPSEAREAFGKARANAALLLSRHGPWGLPAVVAAKARPTSRRGSSTKRAVA